jgi:predicted NUDIX family NTP pyrophosphohydrolase
MSVRTSAGILLYRLDGSGPDGLEVLLAHPGGPYFERKDLGDWTIPKGEPDEAAESLEDVARREFAEETGTTLNPAAPTLELGSIVQKGGKVVHGWAVQGDLDPVAARSNEIEIEWPPRSGRRRLFPEIDRVAWFDPAEARRRIKPTQIPFIERLEEALRRQGT